MGYIIMEINYIGRNKIRCALTEQEIKELGFNIDEIIGDSDTTRQFMRVVLNLVEEQGKIQVDAISPTVRAELLQDHSMAITFGEESDTVFKSFVDTVSQIMSQIEPEQMERIKKRRGEKEEQTQKRAAEQMICALQFASLDHIRRMSRVCFPDKIPDSSLYKLKDRFYLILDFAGFSKEEMRPFAFGTVEYDEEHYSDMVRIAYIREQGTCIMRKAAVETLMQL